MARLKKRAMDRRRALKVIGATGAWTVLGPTVTGAQADISPFRIRISDAELADLRRRLSNIRWPPDATGKPWSMGTDLAYMKELGTAVRISTASRRAHGRQSRWSKRCRSTSSCGRTTRQEGISRRSRSRSLSSRTCERSSGRCAPRKRDEPSHDRTAPFSRRSDRRVACPE